MINLFYLFIINSLKLMQYSPQYIFNPYLKHLNILFLFNIKNYHHLFHSLLNFIMVHLIFKYIHLIFYLFHLKNFKLFLI
jgi:hypothetical protein